MQTVGQTDRNSNPLRNRVKLGKMPTVLRYFIVANISLESAQIMVIPVSLSTTAFGVLTAFSIETSEWTKTHEYIHSP